MDFSYSQLMFPDVVSDILDNPGVMTHAQAFTKWHTKRDAKERYVSPADDKNDLFEVGDHMNSHGFIKSKSKTWVYRGLDHAMILRRSHFGALNAGEVSEELSDEWDEWVSAQIRTGHMLLQDTDELFQWWKRALMVESKPTFYRSLLGWKPPGVNLADGDQYLIQHVIYKMDNTAKLSYHTLNTGRRNNPNEVLEPQASGYNCALMFDPNQDNTHIFGEPFLNLMGAWDDRDETTWSWFDWYRHVKLTFWFPDKDAAKIKGKNPDEKTHFTVDENAIQVWNLITLFDKHGNINQDAIKYVFAPKYKTSNMFAEMTLVTEQFTSPHATRRTLYKGGKYMPDAKDLMHYTTYEMMPFPFHKLYINGTFDTVDPVPTITRTRLSPIGEVLCGGYVTGEGFGKSLRLDLKDFPTTGDHTESKLTLVRAYIILVAMYADKTGNAIIGPGHMELKFMTSQSSGDSHKFANTDQAIEKEAQGVLVKRIQGILKKMGASIVQNVYEVGTMSVNTSILNGSQLLHMMQLHSVEQLDAFVAEMTDVDNGEIDVASMGLHHMRAHLASNSMTSTGPEKKVRERVIELMSHKGVVVALNSRVYKGAELIVRLESMLLTHVVSSHTEVTHAWPGIFDDTQPKFDALFGDDGFIVQRSHDVHHLDIFQQWAESKLGHAIAEDGPQRKLDVDALAVHIPQNSGECMTVAQFITSPYNCCYLPYIPVVSQFEDGETRSPACTRCVCPFYEVEETFMPYGVVRANKIEQFRERPNVQRPRSVVNPTNVECGKPFDVQFSERKESLKLSQDPADGNQYSYKNTVFTIHSPQLYTDKPPELYFSLVVQDSEMPVDGTLVFSAHKNYMRPGFKDPQKRIPDGTGYAHTFSQGFITGSGYTISGEGATYNRARFSFAFCNHLYLERSDTRSNICMDCYTELGGNGRAGVNMVLKPHSRGKLKLPTPQQQVESVVNVVDREGADEEPGPAMDIESCQNDPECVLEMLDSGHITHEQFADWMDKFEMSSELEDAVADIGKGTVEMIYTEMDPIRQQMLEGQKVEENKKLMEQNWNNLKMFNASVKSLMENTEDALTMSMVDAMKVLYTDAAAVINNNDKKLQVEYDNILTNAHVMLSEKKFDRHMFRIEVTNDPEMKGGRTIHDRVLRQEFDRYSQEEDATTDDQGVHTYRNTRFRLPLTQMFAVNFPDITDANASSRQHRTQKMTHIMITYVLHRRAAGEEFNKYVIEKLQQACNRLFGTSMHKVVNFGKTMRQRNGVWVMEDVGVAKKKTNIDNYPESYKVDTFPSHIYYYKCTGGVEIAPITKFFHFHMLVKMTHYSKLMFDYYKMNDWFRHAFLGTHVDPNDNFYIQDVDGTPFYKHTDRPLVDLRLYDQDDWESVAHEYVRKDQMKNKDTSSLITSRDVNNALQGNIV